MYTKEDLNALDKKWREIIFALPIVDNIHEFLLMKYVLSHQEQFEALKKYPYVFAYEFPIDPGLSQAGKIDLIVATIEDEELQFKIVEFKYLQLKSGSTSRVSRTKKRRKVEEQSFSNARRFKELFKESKVTGTFITNDDEQIYGNRDFEEFLRKEWNKITVLYPFLELSQK